MALTKDPRKHFARVNEFLEHMLYCGSLTQFYRDYPAEQNWLYRQRSNKKNGSMTMEELQVLDNWLPGWFDNAEAMFSAVRKNSIMHLSRNEGLRCLEDLMNVVGHDSAWIMHIYGFNSIEDVAKIPANLNQQAIEDPMYGQLSRKLHVELSHGDSHVRDALRDAQYKIARHLYPGIDIESMVYYWVYFNAEKVCDLVTTNPHMFNFNSLAWYDIKKRNVIMAEPNDIDRIIKLCNDEQYDLVTRSSFAFKRLWDCFMDPNRFEETKTHEEWGIFCKRLAEYYKSCSLSGQAGSPIVKGSARKQTVTSKKPSGKGVSGLFGMFSRK